MSGSESATWLAYWQAARETPRDKERLRRSLIWGVCHVHTGVKAAENEFARYIDTGERPRIWPTVKGRAIDDINAYVAALDFPRWERLPLKAKLEDVVRHVHGLGYVKAAFGLTSGGFADIACIDVHIGRERLGYTGRVPTYRTADAYLADVKRAYGKVRGSGKAQWTDYARLVPAFAREGHIAFFSRIGVTG